jgi:hypothetical protein
MTDERRVTAAALVLGPLLFLVANLVHPKEFATGHEAAQLAKIAEAYQRWQVAHLITYVAILFFAVAVVGLAVIVWRHDRRIGLWGGALGIGGLLALMGVLALDGFAWGIAGEVWGRSDDAGKRTAELVLHDLQSSEWGLMFYVGGLAWVIGMVVLAIALVRNRVVPAWAGALLTVGALLVGLEGAIHSNAFFVVAAAVLLAGGVAVARPLLAPRTA